MTAKVGAPEKRPSIRTPSSRPETTKAPTRSPTGHSGRSTFESSGGGTKPVKAAGTGTGPGPERTKGQALADAHRLLRGDVKSDVQKNGATVVRDPANSGVASDRDPNDPRYKEAKAQVEKNRPLEQAALNTLSPTDRAKYTTVQQQTQKAGDPVAELALQTMLLDGKLPGKKDLKGQGNTLDNLATLAGPCTAMAKGIDQAQLVSQVVKEVATPSSISQEMKNTCGPTTAAIHLAMNNPAEYVRLVTGLASPAGQVELAGKDNSILPDPGSLLPPAGNIVLTRVDGTATDDGSGRSISQRLLEPAFMNYANEGLGYDNGRDTHTIVGVPTGVAGAMPFMEERLLSGIYGTQFSHVDLALGDKSSNMQDIGAAANGGQPVPVMVQYNEGIANLHWVLVTKMDDKQVSYTNPWGREETMPRDKFEEMLRGYTFDPNAPCS